MAQDKQFINFTGIRCKETYPYKVENNKPIIDFDIQKQTIYNSDFNLSRSANIAEVIAYTKGGGAYGKSFYNKDDEFEEEFGEPITNYPVYKKDYLNNIAMSPTIDVDIEIQRGNTAAFEKHFKLTECNTLEDLENYGNNIFNL